MTSRTVILGAEDWAEIDILGWKLSMIRSGLIKRLKAASLKFLALFISNGMRNDCFFFRRKASDRRGVPVSVPS